MNIRMTIPKNRDSSGTAILYIVGTSVFISSGQRFRLTCGAARPLSPW